MDLKLIETNLNDCFIILVKPYSDIRGNFVKTFSQKTFKNYNLNVDWVEQYFTFSESNVLRGLHFQTPPHDHAKLVFCVSGKVHDVMLDLRKNSPTYGNNFSIDLTDENGIILYIPSGIAHGFCTLEDNTSVIYFTTNFYNKDSEETIKYNDKDLKITWPNLNCKVKLSRKDLNGKNFFDITY